MSPLLKTDNFEEFEYVVERKPPHPCFFGSKVPRNTDPIGKGLSPFQKMEAPELNPTVGPGYYAIDKYNTAMDKLLKKVKKSFGNSACTCRFRCAATKGWGLWPARIRGGRRRFS
jgi:hypothetical protein